jgi:hypothetical protein
MQKSEVFCLSTGVAFAGTLLVAAILWLTRSEWCATPAAGAALVTLCPNTGLLPVCPAGYDIMSSPSGVAMCHLRPGSSGKGLKSTVPAVCPTCADGSRPGCDAGYMLQNDNGVVVCANMGRASLESPATMPVQCATSPVNGLCPTGTHLDTTTTPSTCVPNKPAPNPFPGNGGSGGSAGSGGSGGSGGSSDCSMMCADGFVLRTDANGAPTCLNTRPTGITFTSPVGCSEGCEVTCPTGYTAQRKLGGGVDCTLTGQGLGTNAGLLPTSVPFTCAR